MSVPARGVRTFEELYAEIRALPEGRTAMILEPGELTVMPRPHARHQRVMKGLLRALGGIDADGDGDGWWILAEVEVRFGERLLVPDLVGYRVANVPELPEENALRIIPEWTCEILSPSSARDDRLKTLRLCAQEGVAWTWIVDPVARSIECFESASGLPKQVAVAADGETVRLPPFDLPIVVERLWGKTTKA